MMMVDEKKNEICDTANAPQEFDLSMKAEIASSDFISAENAGQISQQGTVVVIDAVDNETNTSGDEEHLSVYANSPTEENLSVSSINNYCDSSQYSMNSVNGLLDSINECATQQPPYLIINQDISRDEKYEHNFVEDLNNESGHVVYQHDNDKNSYLIDFSEVLSPVGFLTDESEKASSVIDPQLFDKLEIISPSTNLDESKYLSIQNSGSLCKALADGALQDANDEKIMDISIMSSDLHTEAVENTSNTETFDTAPRGNDFITASINATHAETEVHSDRQDCVSAKSSNIVVNLLDVDDTEFISFDSMSNINNFADQNSVSADEQMLDEPNKVWLSPAAGAEIPLLENRTGLNGNLSDTSFPAAGGNDSILEPTISMNDNVTAAEILLLDPTEHTEGIIIEREEVDVSVGTFPSESSQDKIVPDVMAICSSSESGHMSIDSLGNLPSTLLPASSEYESHTDELVETSSSSSVQQDWVMEDIQVEAESRKDFLSEPTITMNDNVTAAEILLLDPTEHTEGIIFETFPSESSQDKIVHDMVVSSSSELGTALPHMSVDSMSLGNLPSTLLPASSDYESRNDELVETCSSSSVQQDWVMEDIQVDVESIHVEPRTEGQVDSLVVEGLIVDPIKAIATIGNDSIIETAFECVSVGPSEVETVSEMVDTTSISEAETALCNLSTLSDPNQNLPSSLSSVSPEGKNLEDIEESFPNSVQQVCVDEVQLEDNDQRTVSIAEPSTASYSVENEKNDDADGDEDDDDWDAFQGPVVENSEEFVVESLPQIGNTVDDEDDWDDFEGPVQDSVTTAVPTAVTVPVASSGFVPAVEPVIERIAATVEIVEFAAVRNRFSQQTIQRATEIRNDYGSNIVAVLQREFGGFFSDEILCFCFAALGDLTDAIFFGASPQDPDPAGDSSPLPTDTTPDDSLRQDRSLSLQFSFQQLGQLVKDHNHCLPAEDSLSPEELQTVLKMHAHQRKLNKVVTPTVHHSPVGSSLRADQLTSILASSLLSSDANSGSSFPKEAANSKSESRDDELAVSHLSSAALLFLQELPDLTFLL